MRVTVSLAYRQGALQRQILSGLSELLYVLTFIFIATLRQKPQTPAATTRPDGAPRDQRHAKIGPASSRAERNYGKTGGATWA